MNTTIRPVKKTDLLAVRAQLIETWHATYDAIYGPEKVQDITRRWHSLVKLAEQVDAAGSTFLLAETNSQVLGSSYAQIDAGVATLYRLYIHPKAQGHGLGWRLMRATFQQLPDATQLRLEVEPRNLGAIGFYERAGFIRTGMISADGPVGGIAALVYERKPL